MKTRGSRITLDVHEDRKGVWGEGECIHSRCKDGPYFLGYVMILDFIPRGIENY